MIIIDGEKKRKADKASEIAYKTWESKKSVNEKYSDTLEQEYQRTLKKMDEQDKQSTRWKNRGKKLPDMRKPRTRR
jgi:hypothetical protein